MSTTFSQRIRSCRSTRRRRRARAHRRGEGQKSRPDSASEFVASMAEIRRRSTFSERSRSVTFPVRRFVSRSRASPRRMPRSNERKWSALATRSRNPHAGFGEHFIREVARVTEYQRAYELYRGDMKVGRRGGWLTDRTTAQFCVESSRSASASRSGRYLPRRPATGKVRTRGVQSVRASAAAFKGLRRVRCAACAKRLKYAKRLLVRPCGVLLESSATPLSEARAAGQDFGRNEVARADSERRTGAVPFEFQAPRRLLSVARVVERRARGFDRELDVRIAVRRRYESRLELRGRPVDASPG